MLIYNYQKEFLGIDENDLKSLGFSDFAHLRNEAADFADFFVRTPGFVHNFKHVHWIDFVTCAESNEDSKVIIHANGKNFRCTLDIRTAYLVDNPNQKAYLIHLMNLRALTKAESEQISGDVLERAPLVGSSESKVIATGTSTQKFIPESNFEAPKAESFIDKKEDLFITDDPYEPVETVPEATQDITYDDSPIDLGEDFSLSEEETPKVVQEAPKPVPAVEEISVVEEEKPKKAITQLLNVGADYIYDPHVASDELGLPVDLIEEFIQDFINQANDFKDDLYSSLRDENISNLKILSHKLKGVAANLRVEDALEVLTTINTVEDTEVIEMNLDTFYVIISNLSGQPLQQKQEEVAEEEVKEDDDLVISFKDDVKDEVNTDAPLEIPDFEDEALKVHKPSANDDKIELDMQELEEPEMISESVEEPKTEPEIELEPKIEIEPEEIDVKSEIEVNLEPEVEIEPEVEVNLEPEVEQLPDDIDAQLEREAALKYEDISYSKSHVANEIGISIENFNELFEDYMSEASIACDEIEKAIQNNDVEAWQKNAIKLKGMSDNMRVHDVIAELKSIIYTSDTNIAKKAIGVVSNKLQQISKVEV